MTGMTRMTVTRVTRVTCQRRRRSSTGFIVGTLVLVGSADTEQRLETDTCLNMTRVYTHRETR